VVCEGGENDGGIKNVRESGKTKSGSAAEIVVAGRRESIQIKRRRGGEWAADACL